MALRRLSITLSPVAARNKGSVGTKNAMVIGKPGTLAQGRKPWSRTYRLDPRSSASALKEKTANDPPTLSCMAPVHQPELFLASRLA
jgi:hypothetical protein